MRLILTQKARKAQKNLYGLLRFNGLFIRVILLVALLCKSASR